MSPGRRRRVLWLAGTLAAFAIFLGVAINFGWSDHAWSRIRQITIGHDAAHSEDMHGMEGMERMERMEGMQMGESAKRKERASGVPGYAPITIEPGIQQRIGVTIEKVERQPLRMSVKTVGIVQPDETKNARIHLRTEGWVEELFVNFTGQTVQEGDRLLAIYSPDFVAAEGEYLVARGSPALGTAQATSPPLVESALQKLRLLGVPGDEIRDIERTGKPATHLTLRSPVSGTVLEKDVLQGEYVTAERELYVVSDLSTVWVQAKVYQYELAHIELGKPATVTIAGLPGQQFDGNVVFIQPTVEKDTRTVQVRIELPNPDGLLKPDMFVEVEIEHPMGEGLLVPVSAVFRTGERDIVFRAKSGNRFTPVEVEVSPLKFEDEQYHIQGLNEGDRIITSANFLIDSESRLRFGGGGMMPGMPGMEMDMGSMKDMKGMEDMKGMDHSKMKH